MVIAVITVRVVEMTVNQVIDVVAMRYRLVSTTGAVDVTGIMSRTFVVGGAGVRVRVADLDGMLFDLSVGTDMMHVTVV